MEAAARASASALCSTSSAPPPPRRRQTLSSFNGRAPPGRCTLFRPSATASLASPAPPAPASPAPPALLEAESVSYQPDGCGVRLLDGCSLRLEKGTLGLLIGRSGVGKSTLLHLLAGFDQPSEGRVLLEGSPAAAARSGRVGLVFQFPERHWLSDTLAGELVRAIGWGNELSARIPVLPHPFGWRPSPPCMKTGVCSAGDGLSDLSSAPEPTLPISSEGGR